MKTDNGPEVQHHGFFSMATRFDLVLIGMEQKDGADLARRLRDECERIEDLISIHRPGSALSLLNSSAHSGTVETDPELLEILRDLASYRERTRGYFDPSFSSWSHPQGRTGTSVSTLTPAIKIMPEGISFQSRDLKLDLGGYGKGYAVKCMIPFLEEAGVQSALLSFGESLILGYGSHPYGKGWPLVLPLAGKDGKSDFLLENEALSVSGNTLNNRKKFANSGHIVNPLTGQTRKESGVVCVKSKDPVEAEVFSTALFSAGPEEGKKLLESIPGMEARWFMD